MAFSISKSRGFLGSTDKIINDPSENQPGALEMKYLKVKPDLTLNDVLIKQSICCDDKENLKLNKNHKYFFHSGYLYCIRIKLRVLFRKNCFVEEI